MISEAQYKISAESLGVEEAAIKAVAEVESSGSGFIKGLPVILFEPHIFWRQLVQRGVNPKIYQKGNEDILYQKWGEKPYGKVSEQHARLQRATTIYRDAALASASWGKFQILGLHFKACGCKTIQEFVNAMYESEDKHLELFCNFIVSQNMVNLLKTHAWAAFARQYNGAGYKKNRYDIRLEEAYKKHL
jgi:hypothetical protein